MGYASVMTADRNVVRLRALAHPTRLGMVQRLAATPEICACDLGDAFDVSQPTISEHLRVLRNAGLVRTRRDGTSICYSLAPDAVAEVAGLLSGLAGAGAGGSYSPAEPASASSSAA
jgi:DNA-binding transcriptional ArsR family regulator